MKNPQSMLLPRGDRYRVAMSANPSRVAGRIERFG